jgi:hypothetical protein
MRQARTAKPRPQLEAVLQRFFVFVVVIGGIFHDDGVVAFKIQVESLRLEWVKTLRVFGSYL